MHDSFFHISDPKNQKGHTSSDNIGISILITWNFMPEILWHLVDKRFLFAFWLQQKTVEKLLISIETRVLPPDWGPMGKSATVGMWSRVATLPPQFSWSVWLSLLQYPCCERKQRAVGLVVLSAVTRVMAHRNKETGLQLVRDRLPSSLFWGCCVLLPRDGGWKMNPLQNPIAALENTRSALASPTKPTTPGSWFAHGRSRAGRWEEGCLSTRKTSCLTQKLIR